MASGSITRGGALITACSPGVAIDQRPYTAAAMSPAPLRPTLSPRRSRPGSREATMSNQIVVTGAAGWIGGHVCRVLRRLGWDVVGVSRSPEVAREKHPDRPWIGIG